MYKIYKISLNKEEDYTILPYERWKKSVLGYINRMATVYDHLTVFYEKYRILERSCEERICRCGPLSHRKANSQIGRVPKCDCRLSGDHLASGHQGDLSSSCFNCELWFQKTIGTSYPPRCHECNQLFPIFSIRLQDLPKVLHPTHSYTPHCSRKIIDFNVWKVEVERDNYEFAFWYNKTLAECIIEYTEIQMYDIDTTYPNPGHYLSMNLNDFMRESLYGRYSSWTRFLKRWITLYKEFDSVIKQESSPKEVVKSQTSSRRSLRDLVESGL